MDDVRVLLDKERQHSKAIQVASARLQMELETAGEREAAAVREAESRLVAERTRANELVAKIAEMNEEWTNFDQQLKGAKQVKQELEAKL